MKRLCVIAVIIGLVSPVWAQQDFSAVQIQTVEVSDGVYMLVGAGGNIGLSVGEDGAFVIDGFTKDFIDGGVVNYDLTNFMPAFVVKVPGKGQCGCGSSFVA